MNEPLFSLKNRWFTVSVGAVVLIAILAAAFAFVWLPRAHARDVASSLWNEICRAAGAPAAYRNPGLPDEHAVFPTTVIVTSDMLGKPDQAAIGRGATLAQQCSMCHGARGTASSGTNAPHLAGQSPSFLYKQLRDFKSGHRLNDIMTPLADNLNDQEMRDLAAYYSVQTRDTLIQHAGVQEAMPRMASNGSPMRNIGACATCHDVRAARVATPILDGMPEAYLHDQLMAFRAGRRANDINEQMRNAARQLTEQEVNSLARYYANR